jgi:hypothetical protein
MRPSIGQQVKSTPDEEIPVQNPQRPPRLRPPLGADRNHPRRAYPERFAAANEGEHGPLGHFPVDAAGAPWAAFWGGRGRIRRLCG